MNHDYQNLIDQLVRAGVEGAHLFYEKLRDNKDVSETIDDLLFEARAALMFRQSQFLVEMSDRPDLRLAFSSQSLFAEVKHFRMKEQDRIDQAHMQRTNGLLVPIGDTVPTEKVAAWIQVANVAERKATVFVDGFPNILLIGSSSPHCIDDAIIPTSINIIAERVSQKPRSDLRKLIGIMLISPDFNVGQRRNVYFFPTKTPAVAMRPDLEAALQCIRKG